MTRVFIVGGGAGAMALLPILQGYTDIKVVGVADILDSAPAIHKASKLGIPTSNSYRILISETDPDVIINVTGSEGVSRDLHNFKKTAMEIIEGRSAKLLFKIVDERKKHKQEISNRLKTQKMLHDIGLMLTATTSEKREDMLDNIVKCAMQLTNTPAGSIALCIHEHGDMEMLTSIGFSDNIEGKSKWKINQGGLTEHIINYDTTFGINDTGKAKKLDRPFIKDEKIMSLIAAPLTVNNKTIGILYVDDFKPRKFTKKDKSIIALLATQAAATIEKLHILEKTRVMAITDELTSLYNHRFFTNALRDEMKRSRRYKRKLSILLIDVDHFKHYNDTHGHLRGNTALKKISKVMKKAIRDVDILARYGGEEFAIIVPETCKKEALQSAERIRLSVENAIFNGENRQPLGKLTVSVGVATYWDDAKTESSVMNRADKALFRAKKEGRNRVVGH